MAATRVFAPCRERALLAGPVVHVLKNVLVDRAPVFKAKVARDRRQVKLLNAMERIAPARVDVKLGHFDKLGDYAPSVRRTVRTIARCD